MEDEFVLLSEAAREVDLTAERLRQLIKAGDLPGHQLGGRYWYIHRSDLDEFKTRPRQPSGWPKGKPRKSSKPRPPQP